MLIVIVYYIFLISDRRKFKADMPYGMRFNFFISGFLAEPDKLISKPTYLRYAVKIIGGLDYG